MTTPNYKFKNADTSRGLVPSGEGVLEAYHPLLSTALVPVAGFLLILNGWNLNRAMSDIVGYDGTAATAVQLLQMRAPREPAAPLISMPGEGHVFRPGAMWRYRWKNSRTGEASGLSPIPDKTLDMGVETLDQSTTTLGQTAYFYIPTAAKPAHADTIELFANTANEASVWYLTDSKPIGSSSYVLLTDDHTDEELFLQLAVVTGSPTSTPAGPTWSEGIMPPMVKAWLHPSGRVFYYGLRRFGVVGPTEVPITVTQGSDLVSMNAIADRTRLVDPGRIGQRVRFFSSITPVTPIVDPTVYRIIKMESASTFRVWPELQISTTLVEGASATTWYISIEDDRDARWTYMSEPGFPWLIDPLKILAAGDDYDDGVLHWFTTQGTGDLTSISGTGDVFMQTKRRIYRAIGGTSDNPAASTTFVPAADEGSTGFHAGCATPFGWVYFHESRGIRVFDGISVRPLQRDGDPYQEFLARTQIDNFDPAYHDDVRLIYDPEAHGVLVSYVPRGNSTKRECLFFSAAERVWRGPYRESVSAHGTLRGTASSDVLVLGDSFGGLGVREAQALDWTPTLTGFAGTGSITSVQTSRVFTDSGASFNGDSDERARGSPVWFLNAAGTTYYFARIVDVLSSTQLELDGPPVDEDGNAVVLTTGWTYGIGSIRWSVLTAYIDAMGDPAKLVEFNKLDVRFKRGNGATIFEASASENASGTYSGQNTIAPLHPASTRDSNAVVHGELKLKREGALIQLRLRGTSRTSDPQITKALLVGEERDGSLPT